MQDQSRGWLKLLIAYGHVVVRFFSLFFFFLSIFLSVCVVVILLIYPFGYWHAEVQLLKKHLMNNPKLL